MGRYRPRHQAQLGRGVGTGTRKGSRDCGPRAWQVLIDFLTKGQLHPGPAELRRRSNTSGFQQTNTADAEKAFRSYKNIKGRKPLKYARTRSISVVRAAMDNGKVAHIAIDYGKFNQLANKTGDPNFTGGHSVSILDQRRKANGQVMWLLYDSLDDHRRGGIPQGPRWVRRSYLIKSMEAFGGGKGKCWAGIPSGGGKR